MSKKGFPSIHVFSDHDDQGKVAVIVNLKRSKVLHDVNIKLLRFAIDRWSWRNIFPSDGDENYTSFNRPYLAFTVSIGETYKGQTVLCVTENALSELNYLEKLAIRWAFKFANANRKNKTSDLTTQKSLRVMADHAVLTIRQLDKESFDAVFRKLKEFHLLLLSLGEVTEDKSPINYAVIEASLFGTLHEEWSRVYRDIFDQATRVLDEDSDFFEQCCYTAYSIGQFILENPSLIGLDSTMRMQGYLAFRLNQWWEDKCDKEGKRHQNALPAEISPPAAKIFVDATKSYISGWENLHKYVLAKAIDKFDWKSYGKIFDGFEKHLQSTIGNLVRSVITGNKSGALYWTDYLVHWNSNCQALSQENWEWAVDRRHRIKITSDLLQSDFESALQLFNNVAHLQVTPSQNGLMRMILENYWVDALNILTGFLLNWSVNINPKNPPLSAEVARRLIHGIRHDDASIHGKFIFLENYDDYSVSFLRRISNHRWEKGYGQKLEKMAEFIDSFTEAEKFTGRVYSWTGSSIEKIQEADLVLGAIAIGKQSISADAMRESLLKLIDVDIAERNIEHDIKNAQELLPKIDERKYDKIFSYIFSDQDNIPEAELSVDQEYIDELISSMEPEASNNLTECFQVQKSVLDSMAAAAKELRTEKIRSLPIADEALKSIGDDASSSIVDSQKRLFPLALFQEIEVGEETLKQFKLRNANFPKGALTKPRMDNVHFGKDWHSRAISGRLNPYIVFDIYNAATSNDIIQGFLAYNERDYAVSILEAIGQIRRLGFSPIVIAENFETPYWLESWNRSIWRRDALLPEGIEISHEETRQRSGYHFSINDAAVYTSRALVGGTLVLAREHLKKAKFKKLAFGNPVAAHFEADVTDPWHGILTYEIEHGVELRLDIPMFKIAYPNLRNDEAHAG